MIDKVFVMRLVYCGSGKFGLPCLKGIYASDNVLVHVFTQPMRTAGRGKKPKPTPVARWAAENSVLYTETADINAPEMVEKICSAEPDLLVVAAFGQKISKEVIELPGKGAINVHGSLLPKYRGAAPVNWAIINGENETGVSIITLASEMDAGRILSQIGTIIHPNDTAETLENRLGEIAAPLLTETIAKIAAGTAKYTVQDESAVSRAPKLKKSDGYIDFNESAVRLTNLIRGLWPWPGAQADYVSRKSEKCCRVTIAQAVAVPRGGGQVYPSGVVDQSLNVTCGQGGLRILKIKPAGGGLMEFRDFVNGRGTSPGDLFMKIDR
ncbi:MAG: methionyl-tRNA formyltransferase [Planctomycetota bacterium]